MAHQRYRPHIAGIKISPNQSSRNGRKPVLITVHSTEGSNIPHSSRDLFGTADYLGQPSVEASCHVITDGDGNSVRVVRDARKAWHCAYFNAISLGIEQVGRAGSEHWLRDEYRETARWIALWSRVYGIPIRHAAVHGRSVVRTGVIRHSELGMAGGGHSDPGPRYDLAAVLNLAKFYRSHL